MPWPLAFAVMGHLVGLQERRATLAAAAIVICVNLYLRPGELCKARAGRLPRPAPSRGYPHGGL
eukprot:3628304-Lingulodinium_polyedra.AAC.1